MKQCLLFLLTFASVYANAQSMSGKAPVASAQIVIYKTKANYSKNVPVLLSADQKLVMSYPAKSDININGAFTYPTKLPKGYLLDNRGINANTVFLDLTYEEYFKMEKIDPLILATHILDKQPFLQMYSCGNRMDHTNLVEDMKILIKKNKLKDCKCTVSQP